MKIYKNLAEAVLAALKEIFQKRQLANKTVEATLRSNKKWGGRDRRFLAEQIYESVRWYRQYYEAGLGYAPETDADWWQFMAAAWTLQGIELPDWPELEGCQAQKILKRNSELHLKRVIYTSIPDWLDDYGVKQLGEELWTKTMRVLNQPAKVVLRTNRLKTTRAKLLEQLDRVAVHAEAYSSADAIVLDEARQLSNLQLFKEGLFEVQDYSSQQVAALLNPKPGSIVIDACAGAGGKTLHLAALMQNKGQIFSIDIDKYKLRELEKRAMRAGVKIVKTQLFQAGTKIEGHWNEKADYLLIDAPCSGSGVFRRNPDAKWRLSLDFIEEIQHVQRNILLEYPYLCKKGARMLYATCSIFPDENEKQIEWFLSNTAIGKDFELLEEHRILPQDEGFDGFYMAVLRRQ